MKVILLGLALIFRAYGAAVDLPSLSNDGQSSMTTQDVASRRGEFKPPPIHLDASELNFMMFSEIQEQNADLKRVKYYLVNGETRLAQVHLTKLAYTNTKLKPVIYRYLGILAFIEGRFQKSYDYLSLKELQEISHYKQICTLKALNLIVLDRKNKLEKEWQNCLTTNLKHFDDDHFVWIDTLVQLKLKPRPGFTQVPFKGVRIASMANDQIKIILKLALYLNQEKIVEEQLNDLDITQINDNEVRELIGQVYFRLGSLVKAYRFIEDLKSPNAENIKGNLYILRKKYELAYAQFKLALEQKQNSQNAMERILPLAWLLGDWEEGAKIAERVIAAPQTQINKMTLVAAFYTQKGDYDKAKETMDNIVIRSRRGTEIDVTQLHSFVGLMQNKVHVVKKKAALSCQQYDLINCWLSLQLEQWDSFPLTIRRPDKLPVKKEWERLSQETISQPLTETVYVNQLDIEELDDKLIKLVPNGQ
jgi:tetratricopeptide (TPR) repeat protein